MHNNKGGVLVETGNTFIVARTYTKVRNIATYVTRLGFGDKGVELPFAVNPIQGRILVGFLAASIPTYFFGHTFGIVKPLFVILLVVTIPALITAGAAATNFRIITTRVQGMIKAVTTHIYSRNPINKTQKKTMKITPVFRFHDE